MEDCDEKMIDHPLFHRPVEITQALVTVASQENCDGPEHDLLETEEPQIYETPVGFFLFGGA